MCICSEGVNNDISFNGTDLFHEGTATATSGQGDFAVAFGDGAHAIAGGDASAAGAGSTGIGDTAFADGTNAFAASGGDLSALGNFDNAVDVGNNTLGGLGAPDGAYAGSGGVGGIGEIGNGGGSFDNAFDFGNNTPIEGSGGNEGAFAGAGGLIDGGPQSGRFDTAFSLGNQAGADNGAEAVGGDFNLASEVGNFPFPRAVPVPSRASVTATSPQSWPAETAK